MWSKRWTRKPSGSPRLERTSRDKLEHDSYVIVEQPRTLDRRRLGERRVALVNTEELSLISQRLLAVLGFYPESG